MTGETSVAGSGKPSLILGSLPAVEPDTVDRRPASDP